MFMNINERSEKASGRRVLASSRDGRTRGTRERRDVVCVLSILSIILKSHVLKRKRWWPKEICRCAASHPPCLSINFQWKKVQKLTRGLASERAITNNNKEKTKETKLN